MIKLEITTHSNVDDKGRSISEVVETEEYDALETFNIINGITKNETGNAYNVLLLGENMYSCLDIKSIKVVKESTEEEPEQSAE